MSLLYFDTSCLPPYFTPEADTRRTVTFFTAPPADARLALSHWTITEFHSAIALKIRSGQMDAKLQAEVLTRFNHAVESSFENWAVTAQDFEQAGRYVNSWKSGLRAADALHLAIAHNRSAMLVTLDKILIKAAQHHKVPVRSL